MGYLNKLGDWSNVTLEMLEKLTILGQIKLTTIAVGQTEHHLLSLSDAKVTMIKVFINTTQIFRSDYSRSRGHCKVFERQSENRRYKRILHVC